MQNYREASHPQTEARTPSTDLRQVLVVAAAAILVALALSAVAFLGARLNVGGEDCVLTDNAGCIETGSAGSAGEVAAGVETRKGV